MDDKCPNIIECIPDMGVSSFVKQAHAVPASRTPSKRSDSRR
jgi:hypothetical protein